MRKLKLAVLISGRGSNMDALIKACAEPDFPAEIAVVVSNRPGAGGIEKAKAAGLATEIVDHKVYTGRGPFEAVLYHANIKHGPIDLVCLAGFMRVLTPWFVDQWPERMINIHPSLLPDYKGVDTHARSLGTGEAGCAGQEISHSPTLHDAQEKPDLVIGRQAVAKARPCFLLDL